MGRPDLAGKAAEWTDDLWSSLEKSRDWPDDMLVLPAHYASEDERSEERTVARPLGAVRSSNEPLQISDSGAFREWVAARKTSFPQAYRKIKGVNIGIIEVDEDEAQELEAGKNECAV